MSVGTYAQVCSRLISSSSTLTVNMKIDQVLSGYQPGQMVER